MGTFLAMEQGCPLGQMAADKIPHHWVRAMAMYRRVKVIHDNSNHDPDRLVAPKLYWFDDDLLKLWYKDRSD